MPIRKHKEHETEKDQLKGSCEGVGPSLVEDEPREPLTNYEGLWAHFGVDITEEDIAEARKEMWGGFPRDFEPLSGLLLDTHAAIWYLLRSPQLSRKALLEIRSSVSLSRPIFISSISIVEVQYLVEKKRLPLEANRLLDIIIDNPVSSLRFLSVDTLIARGLREVPRSSVPDMPDRIIAATALVHDLTLVTRDSQLRKSVVRTLW